MTRHEKSMISYHEDKMVTGGVDFSRQDEKCVELNHLGICDEETMICGHGREKAGKWSRNSSAANDLSIDQEKTNTTILSFIQCEYHQATLNSP